MSINFTKKPSENNNNSHLNVLLIAAILASSKTSKNVYEFCLNNPYITEISCSISYSPNEFSMFWGNNVALVYKISLLISEDM